MNNLSPKFRPLLLLAALTACAIGCGESETITPKSNDPVAQDPQDPQNPTDPKDPAGSDDPKDPDGPADPKDPAGPDDPKDPQNPPTTTDPDACKDVDLMTSIDNCGTCGHKCGRTDVCVNGECQCGDGMTDCDNDGICETFGECECEPGDTTECYTGPQGTQDVGECKAGKATCILDPGFGVYWDFANCEGQITPNYKYICDPARPDLDLDCDGTPDATQDSDNDGFKICNDTKDAILDCCDNAQSCNTQRPDLINPGRIDCFGNHIDDNCSGTPDDNPEVLCGTQTSETEANCKIKNRTCSDLSSWKFGEYKNISAAGALALAQAFDACLNVVTEQSGEPGLIEFSISPASDYNIGIDPRQFNIKDGLYDAHGTKLIEPRVGDTFVILSSGIAGDAKTELNAFGTDDMKMSLGGSIPEPYRTAHKNQLQTHPSCASGGADIYDTVRLHLKMRAPQNAKGISFDFRFFSREYPYYVCSKYNDFFLALLTDASGKAIVNDDPTKADGNISFDRDGNPISVNNAFFTTCAPAPCSGNFEKPMADKCPAMLSCKDGTCGGDLCTDGKDELAAYYPQFYSSASDDPKTKRGGGTAWLTTKAPVTPGEIFNLDFYIWDTGDLRFDSSVILDNFQWSCETTTNATDFAQPVEPIN
ncbi:MAG: choice-of-anchor L domain-containing protein [Proteobacteria bacterium]|nr:choice-of-anchor L domain-containing protein [Pseudomonadota bacterium]